jgi:hypothetical protein
MKVSIDGIASRLASSHEGSILTSYGDDDKAAWKELRRALHREGFEDSFVRENRNSIMGYVKELGDKGAFDEAAPSVLISDSVDDEITEEEFEAADCKEEVIPSSSDHEAIPHKEDGQLSTKLEGGASTNVERSHTGEVEEQRAPTDQTGEESCRDENSPARLKDTDSEKMTDQHQ